VKGYGETHERGQAKFDKLVALLPRLRGQSNSAATLEALIKTALADEGGEVLDKAIAELAFTNSARAASSVHSRPAFSRG
jgi:indolepyruvate ferredoxin oxidoreductase beta subunit